MLVEIVDIILVVVSRAVLGLHRLDRGVERCSSQDFVCLKVPLGCLSPQELTHINFLEFRQFHEARFQDNFFCRRFFAC